MTAKILKPLGWLLILLLCAAEIWAQEPKSTAVVQKGTTFRLQYTIFDEQGTVIESNKGGDPVRYAQGQGQVIPGVDRALEGMRIGDKKTLQLKPEDAYGRINPAARLVVPKAKIPAELVTVGAKVLAHAGRQILPGRIQEIREDTVVVDFNHPLAGKTITVEFEVVGIISPAQKSEPGAS